ncbi:MAG: AhpC/TSA family protein [Bacteroidota bacterium]|nr:AhpC/TSA family protein [Bacteroidota bacterium]
MKQIFFLLVLLPFLSFAQTKKTAGGFVIEGQMRALPNGTNVTLFGFNGTDTLAKTKVQNGGFTLTGMVNNIDARIIAFSGLTQRLVVFMGNDDVKVKGDSSNFTDVIITGSPSNYDYEEFLYQIKPLNDYVTMYRNSVQSATTQGAKDSLLIALNTTYNIYQESIDRFIARKKGSPVSSLVLAYSYDTDPNKDVVLLQKRFNTLTGTALQSQFAKNISQVIDNDKIGAVGTKAIDFTQTDTAGNSVSLSQFKGKYVLLDFWASWCRPCRAENPNVVAAYNTYKNKNFTVLSVSLDETKDSWLRAIKADNLMWTHLSDLKYWSNAVAMEYHIQSIPQNFLIDPNGVIIAKNLRGEQLFQKLKELLK